MRYLSTDIRRARDAACHSTHRRRVRHPHLPLLFYQVQSRSWEDAIRRARSHPHEIVVQEDMSGNTPLHVACRFDPPPEVVTALLAARHEQNAEGATPLHVAASHRCSVEVIAALLRNDGATEDSSEKDCDSKISAATSTTRSPTTSLTRMGRAPIHYACMSFRGLSVDAFKLLLDATVAAGPVQLDDDEEDDDDLEELHQGKEQNANALVIDKAEFGSAEDDDDDDEDPKKIGSKEATPVNAVTMLDATGRTPLGLLFRRYRERVRCVIKMVESQQSHRRQLLAQIQARGEMRGEMRDEAAIAAATAAIRADLGELWEKARLIVTALADRGLHRDGTVPGAVDDALEVVERRISVSSTSAEESAAMEAAAWAAEQHRPLRSSSSFHSRSSAHFASATTIPSIPEEEGPEGVDFEEHAEFFHDENEGLNADRTETREPTNDHNFRIVHASVGLVGYGCPPEMIRLAVSIHPEQVFEMDEYGNLPLHIAAVAASYLGGAPSPFSAPDIDIVAGNLGANPPDDSSVGTNGASSMVSLRTNDSDSLYSDGSSPWFGSSGTASRFGDFDRVIRILLRAYPGSARIPHGRTGRLPFVLAVEGGRRSWDDGIRTLLEAYPAALESRDIRDARLYPKILSLVARRTSLVSTGSRCSRREEDQLDGEGTNRRVAIGRPRVARRGPAAISQRSATGMGNNVTAAENRMRKSLTTIFELVRAKPDILRDAAMTFSTADDDGNLPDISTPAPVVPETIQCPVIQEVDMIETLDVGECELEATLEEETDEDEGSHDIQVSTSLDCQLD